jgi:hypothetical protein
MLGHALLAAGLTIDVPIAKSDEERDLNHTYASVYRSWRPALEPVTGLGFVPRRDA